MCPVYVAGLIDAGDRKSVQPIAARDAQVGYDQLHHFIAGGVWDAAPLENTLLARADAMVGGDDAWLIVDDTALPKKGAHSVGVAPQYASALGKNANCQTLVSLTLAAGEVPVVVGSAAVPARELDVRSSAIAPRRRAGGSPDLSNQAGDRVAGD